MRMRMVSTKPPKNPETAPTRTPTTVAIPAAAKPTSSEIWPPYMIRPRMSKPVLSVPERVRAARRRVLTEWMRAVCALVWFVT